MFGVCSTVYVSAIGFGLYLVYKFFELEDDDEYIL